MASAIFHTPKSPYTESTVITCWKRAGQYGVQKRQAWGSVEYFTNPLENPIHNENQTTLAAIELATDEALDILERHLSFPIIGEQLYTDELVVGAIAGEFQRRAECGRASGDYLANQFSLIDWQIVFNAKSKKVTLC